MAAEVLHMAARSRGRGGELEQGSAQLRPECRRSRQADLPTWRKSPSRSGWVASGPARRQHHTPRTKDISAMKASKFALLLAAICLAAPAFGQIAAPNARVGNQTLSQWLTAYDVWLYNGGG